MLGLALYAGGAFLFFPAAQLASFNFFLLAIFVLASGLVCLETAANPYATILGKSETAAFRLNLAQSFNGIGSFLGPIIGARLFFNKTNVAATNDLESVQWVYIIIGVTVVLVFLLFLRTPLPEIKSSEEKQGVDNQTPLISHKHLINAVIAQFFYVAAQVGIAALFINYCTSVNKSIDNAEASYLLSISLLLFTAGRFAGTALMKVIAPNKLLALFSVANIVLCIIVVLGNSWLSVYSLMAIFFFESIMFPTIFALGIKDLGSHTQKGSSLIIMSIVGGALVPYLMGYLADKESIAVSYSIPLLCFIVVAWYGLKGYRIQTSSNR
ncbi:L-fucose-proton symporter [compost metagenome]